MNEPMQQHSDIIEQLQSKIQTLLDGLIRSVFA